MISAGKKLKIEKLEAEEGKEVAFDVLLRQKADKLEIGTPLVEKVKVHAKVLKQGRARKIIIYKYKAKKRYQVKKGHRQPFTQIEITKI